MKFAEVTLVTRDVEPGWPLVDDSVPLGKKYMVDMDRIVGMTITNVLTGRSKSVSCVYVLSPGEPGYLPCMAFGLLDLPASHVTFPTLPAAHVQTVCRPHAGAVTCSYLCQQQGMDFFCAKRTPYEAILSKKRCQGQLKSMGDNCSGPPDYVKKG